MRYLFPLLRWKANCLLRCGHWFSSSSLISTGGKFGASACWLTAACWQSALASSSISISRDGTGGLHRPYHPLYAASTTAVRIVVRDSLLSVSCIELCFFFTQ